MHRRAFLRLADAAPSGGAPDPPLPDLAAAGLTPASHTPAPVRPYTPTEPLAIQAGLEPYGAPLDRRRAAHLLRRTGFIARPAEVDALTGTPAPEAVATLLDQAQAADLPPRPAWADETFPAPPGEDATQEEREAYRQARDEYLEINDAWFQDYRAQWMAECFRGGLREKMTLFWSNHFVTEAEGYFNLAVYAYRYLDLLRTHALGNVRDFVHAVGLNPAMLLYLNGNTSTAEAPNENYARELLELFTMGQTGLHGETNYTQDDIENIARALTGWVVDPFRLQVYLVPALHDDGEKTIFGRSGPFDYDQTIDLLFEERPRAIAAFIAAKLYRAFVYNAPGGGPVYNGLDPDVIDGLADVLLDADFEVMPLLTTLLSSAHFFADDVIGAQIKSPVAAIIGFFGEMQTEPPEADLYPLLDRLAFILQQRLFDPPNVAGWEGHHSWLDTTTLPIRWLAADVMLFGTDGRPPLDLVPLAEQIHDAADLDAAFTLPVALADHLLSIPVEAIPYDVPDEPFAGDLVNHPIPQDVLDGPAYVRDLAKIFLAGVPWYEWNLYFDQSPALLLQYARYLTHLPEYQLT